MSVLDLDVPQYSMISSSMLQIISFSPHGVSLQPEKKHTSMPSHPKLKLYFGPERQVCRTRWPMGFPEAHKSHSPNVCIGVHTSLV